jgi:amino acid adenylation domain-containing protein
VHPIRQTIIDAILLQAAAGPQRVAAIDETRQMRFCELMSESSELSLRLLQRGLKPADRIAILLERGCGFVVACAAVWRIGGVIVPMETHWPIERIRTVWQLANPRGLLTTMQRSTLLSGQDLTGAAFVAMDEAMPASGPDRRQDMLPRGSDAAYVIFTSGSTGQPKAIEGRHDSLLHFLEWETGEFKVSPDVRVSQLAPASFDVSLRDYWLPIMNGGCVVVPSASVRQHPYEMLEWLHAYAVNFVHIVPSVLRLLLDEIDARPDMAALLGSVSVIICAGERLLGRDVARVRSHLRPDIDLNNFYGASEMTLAQVFNRIGRQQFEPADTVPLGRPIDGVSIQIMAGDRPVPAGEVGEIVIETEYASNGYLGEAVPASSRFRRIGWSSSGRPVVSYRTGDRGRLASDGLLTFEGRYDDQVKIHGNRVEPREVETELLRCGSVRQAVVLPRARDDDDVELIAFYVANQAIGPRKIRSELAQRVPPYMVPRRFLPVDRLPLNQNGKIDRRSLLALAGRTAAEQPLRRAPEAAAQRHGVQVRDLVAEALGIPATGDASFAELGGSSLDAMRLAALIERRLQRRVSVADLLRARDTADIEALVERAIGFEQERRIEADGTGHQRPLSIYQRPIHQITEFAPARLAYSERLAFAIDGDLDTDACCRAFTQLIDDCRLLRTRFVRKGQQVFQHVAGMDAAGALDMVDLADASGTGWLDRLNAEWSRPFDLAVDAPVRASLYRIAERRHVLTVVFSHIILDAVGLHILMREAAARYRQYATRQPPAPRQDRPQYADYCEWESRWLGAPGLPAAAAQYWANLLSPPPPRLVLSAKKRPVFKTCHGASVSTETRPEAVLRAAHELGATGFTVLLAVFMQLLHLETGERDVTVGTPFLVRDHPDAVDMVGFFLNMIPVRVAVGDEMTMAELVRAVADRLGQAHGHKEYPFASMVADSAREFTLDRSPVFDVMFTFLPEADSYFGDWGTDGLRCSTISLEATAAKYDLTFHVRDCGGSFYVQAEYNSDIFDRSRAEQLLDRFVGLAGELKSSAAVGRLGPHGRGVESAA